MSGIMKTIPLKMIRGKKKHCSDEQKGCVKNEQEQLWETPET